MATVRRTTPARTKAATDKLILQLTRSIKTLHANLEDLYAKQELFLQTSYVSQKVQHKVFGEGVIVEQKEDIIKVSFFKTGVQKAFVMHRKFTNRPIFENDQETITAFSEFADRRLSITHLEQEKIRLEQQRAELIQAYHHF